MTACAHFTGTFIIAFLLASCVTLSDDERAEKRFEREDELILAKEDFERRSEECRRNGGLMQLPQHSASKITKTEAYEYKMAYCERK